MPVLVDFGGFEIRMYFHDENPPHVHVDSSDYSAKVRIKDQVVYVGEIDPKFRNQALRWIAENRAMLEAKWADYQK